MKLSTFLAILAAGTIAASGTAYTLNQVNASPTVRQAQTTNGSPVKQAQVEPESVQFICNQGYDPVTQARVPTTYAWTLRGKISLVRWKSDWFSGSGFTPEVRCREVAPRFETAYQNGNLNYLTNGRLNGEKVICAVRENGDHCTYDTLLLTLRPKDNEHQALNQLNSILQGDAVDGPIRQNSEEQIYIELDIENFLATAPVEEE